MRSRRFEFQLFVNNSKRSSNFQQLTVQQSNQKIFNNSIRPLNTFLTCSQQTCLCFPPIKNHLKRGMGLCLLFYFQSELKRHKLLMLRNDIVKYGENSPTIFTNTRRKLQFTYLHIKLLNSMFAVLLNVI